MSHNGSSVQIEVEFPDILCDWFLMNVQRPVLSWRIVDQEYEGWGDLNHFIILKKK